MAYASPAGGFLSGFANGFSNARDRKAMLEAQAREAEDRAAARMAPPPALDADAGDGGGYGGGGEGMDRRSGGDAAPFRTNDPVNTDLSPRQRAFLNAISSGESAGKYNIRYTPKGGTTFDLSGGHPRIYEPGPAGQSSAAGRYQFTWSTWRDFAGADTPFTPKNQDKYAWELAARDYQKKTGRDLDADLAQDGMTPQIQHALASTWTSFANNPRARSTYADSLARYSAPAAAPAQAPAPMARSLSFGLDQLTTPQPAQYALGQ